MILWFITAKPIFGSSMRKWNVNCDIFERVYQAVTSISIFSLVFVLKSSLFRYLQAQTLVEIFVIFDASK